MTYVSRVYKKYLFEKSNHSLLKFIVTVFPFFPLLKPINLVASSTLLLPLKIMFFKRESNYLWFLYFFTFPSISDVRFSVFFFYFFIFWFGWNKNAVPNGLCLSSSFLFGCKFNFFFKKNYFLSIKLLSF